MAVDSYFWVALLPPQVEAKVLAIKHELNSRFGLKKALGPPGHISMPAEVYCSPEQAERLKKLSAEAAAATAPVSVQLRGFGAFPNNRTVFIRVEPKTAFQDFWEPFRGRLQAAFGFPAKDIGGKQVSPHLTVAFRDVNPPVFAEIWDEFRERIFDEAVVIPSIHLMTRDERRRWVPVAEYPFAAAGKPTQGNLF